MAHQFHAARWQNYPARRVGHRHLLRIIGATVGESHPDYQDLEARRQMRQAGTGMPVRAPRQDVSGD